MAHNRISIDVTDDELNVALAALGQLEGALQALVALEPRERQRLVKMGQKSEVFCREALIVLEQNPQIVPSSLDVAGARDDLRALERLRPVFDRLQRLTERGKDTELVLGSDVMEVAMEGYRLVKVSGRRQGLDGHRRQLAERWAKARRAAEPELDPVE